MPSSDARAGDVVIGHGRRVRLTDTCPWPERRGLEGVVVAPPSDGTYPQPAKSEVIVKLDKDPLTPALSGHQGWTCVVDRKSVEVLDG